MDLRFILTGAKRVFDGRPFYAQVVVTDDCNLSCAYCDEYAAGAEKVPADILKARIDRLDELGVMVYDLLGGEPLMHPGIADIVAHAKSKRGGSNLVTLITNGFLLGRALISDLNAAGLDFMQVSVDSLEPGSLSQKSLRSVLPRLRLLASQARFKVEVQTVLSEETAEGYDAFRQALSGLPFAFGFSLRHAPGGRIAIRGSRYLDLLKRYGVFEGVNFYGRHLPEMLEGDFSRPWKCLGGFKFLYVDSRGRAQRCAQQRAWQVPLDRLDARGLKENDAHKPCEAGCALGCVRMVSHALGEPLRTLGSSLRLALLSAAPSGPARGARKAEEAPVA